MNKFVLLIAALFSTSALAGEPDWAAVSPDRLREVRALSEAIAKNEASCDEWGKTVESLVTEINKADEHRLSAERTTDALAAIEKFPGLPDESLKLVTLFTDAPRTAGFPANYRWNWREEFRFPRCATISWFALAKGLLYNPSPATRARVTEILRRQLHVWVERGPSLTPVLVNVAVLQIMNEKGFLKLSSAKTKQLKKLVVDTKAYKEKYGTKDGSRLKVLLAQCKDGLKDEKTEAAALSCPKPVDLEMSDLYGNRVADEIQSSRRFGARLVSLLK